MLTDGTSAFVFHGALLSALNSLTTADIEDEDPIVQSLTTPCLPPLEDLHPLPNSSLFILKNLLGLIFPK
jgi:hypothetical protein